MTPHIELIAKSFITSFFITVIMLMRLRAFGFYDSPQKDLWSTLCAIACLITGGLFVLLVWSL